MENQAEKKVGNITELNLISCQGCGNPLITPGKNIRMIIYGINFKCGCGTQGIFDKIIVGSMDDDEN